MNPTPPPRAAPSTRQRWYGWQGLAADGVAVSLGLGALAIGNNDVNEDDFAGRLALVGVAVYGLGAPVIHLKHHKPWHALGSLGLRGSLPFAVAFFTESSASCPPPNQDYGSCGQGDLIGGALTGAVLAIVIDTIVLSWEARREEAPTTARLGLVPVVSTEGRRELRLVGAF